MFYHPRTFARDHNQTVTDQWRIPQRSKTNWQVKTLFLVQEFEHVCAKTNKHDKCHQWWSSTISSRSWFFWSAQINYHMLQTHRICINVMSVCMFSGSQITAAWLVGHQAQWWTKHEASYLSWFGQDLSLVCCFNGHSWFNWWFSFALVHYFWLLLDIPFFYLSLKLKMNDINEVIYELLCSLMINVNKYIHHGSCTPKFINLFQILTMPHSEPSKYYYIDLAKCAISRQRYLGQQKERDGLHLDKPATGEG